jgi:hypothetical protein
MADVAWRGLARGSLEVACWKLGPSVRERNDGLGHAELSSTLHHLHAISQDSISCSSHNVSLPTRGSLLM